MVIEIHSFTICEFRGVLYLCQIHCRGIHVITVVLHLVHFQRVSGVVARQRVVNVNSTTFCSPADTAHRVNGILLDIGNTYTVYLSITAEGHRHILW